MGNLILGLITGIFFGFFLQKGQALKYDRQLGMLRLRDFTLKPFPQFTDSKVPNHFFIQKFSPFCEWNVHMSPLRYD